MATTIYKYLLTVHESIKIPKGATILSANEQDNKAYIWCMVDTNNELEERRFNIYGTGDIIDENINQKFISTVMLWNGTLVFHIFEVLE